MTILETRNLTKQFGKLTAVDEVSISITEGSIHSIIGPNGAGKSTLFNLITSLNRPDSGQVILGGTEITNLPPHEIARRGVLRSFQITDVFGNLDVFENVRLAVQAGQSNRTSLTRRISDGDQTSARTREILVQIGLDGHERVPASDLSYGDRRRLELGLTIGSDPRVILLDEPTAGMGAQETETTVELIQHLANEEDVTVMLIEHDIEFVMDISDTISVLHNGSVIASGNPTTIRTDQSVREAYLGAAEI